MASSSSASRPAAGAGDRPNPTFAQRAWRRFCSLAVRVFYRRVEVTGLHHLSADGPVVLCANHVNALVDAVVIQAVCPRPIHPLARSGLFRRPLLGWLLRRLEAVPIYRRNPQAPVDDRNEDSFRRCYEHLAQGRILLIFPEGQSHSDPMLRPLKTGAARLALGTLERFGILPAVVPVGLTFPSKGRFHSDVLVQVGKPVKPPEAGAAGNDAARRFTAAIEKGLASVTLNLDSWEDLRLLELLHDFFTFRRGRRPSPRRGSPRRRTLAGRFRALQRLIDTHRWLRLTRPDEVALLVEKLRRFERLRRRYGVADYHLELRYRPLLVLRFLLRSLLFAVVVFPLALWGLLNSGLPYLATRQTSLLLARGRDQYDTAGMVFGFVFFLLFWGGQTFAVATYVGTWPAVAYGLSLPVTAAIALGVRYERRRILENVRVFFLFLRQKELQTYLRLKREELEVDVARIVRAARRGFPSTG